MKKLISLLTFLFFVPLLLFSQDVFPGDTSTVIIIPESWTEMAENPRLWLFNVGTLAGAVWVIAGAFIIWLKLPADKKWPKLVTGIVIALVLSIVTKVINWGLFAGDPWLETILGGLGIGAVAGGISDIQTMKVALSIILSLIRIRKTPL